MSFHFNRQALHHYTPEDKLRTGVQRGGCSLRLPIRPYPAGADGKESGSAFFSENLGLRLLGIEAESELAWPE